MANLRWPNFDSSSSTITSTTNPNFVYSGEFFDDRTVPNPAVSCANAIALVPTVSETTFALGDAATITPEGWASAQGWHKYRALITELYPKLMLQEIMELMELEHNFKATEKMYKSRFTQWGLRKNAKRKCEDDQNTGREKRPIDRSGLLPAERAGYLVPTALTKTPRAMRSSASLSPPVITPPTLAIPERILSVIRDYFRGSFEAGTWVANGDVHYHCRSIKHTKSAVAQLSALGGQTQLACHLFNRNSFQDAGKTLISATARIKEIILAEEPRTLIYLFRIVLHTHRIGRNEITSAILRQFSAMAMAVLGNRHPICRISGWLSSIDPSWFDDIINRCVISVCDHFASFVGHTHCTTLMARVEATFGSGEAEEKLRDLLNECEIDLGLVDRRTSYVRLALSSICYYKSKYTEAERLGQEVLARSRKLQSTVDKDYYRAKGLLITAESQYALGEGQSPETHILEAIALASPIVPGQAVNWLWKLEDWQMEQGREDAAAETRERRWKLQESVWSDDLVHW